ncbi:hypothetical protein [Shewanella sp. 10N.286.52.B9]|uniref:hypothetical protein n=1 Tax=Shewanella sp. 10N.286.52.B9 TaxID=1880837 RepID=UPI000C86315F|nr:hypothetical protein [Shewanella sp. 10N.286.52.B9]PMG48056.1 hypothetical protein BCU91_02935 [Shewanella sp. 10N.286.52.B9]
MKYSELSRKAQWHISSNGLPLTLKLAAKNHYLIRGMSIILLVPLCAAIVMAMTLENGEQTYYIFVVLILSVLDFILWSLRQSLVLNMATQTRYIELSFLGHSLTKTEQASIHNTELLLRRSSSDHKQFEMKVHRSSYPVGTLTETIQAVMFISNTFKLAATEQVSHFPQILPLEDSHLSKPPQEIQVSNPLNDANVATEGICITPLWQPIILAKFLLPLPFFLILGLLIKLIAGGL